MKESFREMTVNYLKTLIPFFSTLLLVLICFVPTHIPLSHFLRPDVGLACVYFWVLYHRDVFGLAALALLGIIVDTLSGTPLGVHIAVFVFVYLMTIYFGNLVNTKPFIVSWTGFAGVCLMALFIKGGILSLYHSKTVPILYVLMTYLATVLIYPLITKFNIFLYDKYLFDDEVIYEQG